MEKVTVSIEGIDEVMRKMKKLDDRIKKRIIRKAARRSLKPMVASYKRNIKDADEVFKVYRDGKIYAEIMPGQLRRSVGIKTPKHLQKNDMVGFSVGPRRSGQYRDPEKGGWYAGFINFGWLQVGGGRDYSGSNRGFAQKAQNGAKNKVRVTFVRTFKGTVISEIKKLKFGQRLGLR